jgi:hypothetical protein
MKNGKAVGAFSACRVYSSDDVDADMRRDAAANLLTKRMKFSLSFSAPVVVVTCVRSQILAFQKLSKQRNEEKAPLVNYKLIRNPNYAHGCVIEDSENYALLEKSCSNCQKCPLLAQRHGKVLTFLIRSCPWKV